MPKIRESLGPVPPGPRLAASTWMAREGGKQNPHVNSNRLYFIQTFILRLTPNVALHVMPQNTAVEIASALIRDWRMYWARACMMAWCRSSTMP
jgi:hypothetical protein